MTQFAYFIKGITETEKTKDEVEDDLRHAVEDATDDGLFEVQEIIVDEVSS